MKKLVVSGFLLVVGLEVIAVFAGDRRLVLWISGAAVAVLLLVLRRRLTADAAPPTELPVNDREESLRRWLTRTETLVSWSESTRSDWDRHLRPMLARQFEMATRQRQATDRVAFDATGRMLFGEELWQWVDPNNVARTGGGAPGPGRGALDAILQRLEQV